MIKLHEINKFYDVGEEKLHVLNNINLTINQGEFVAIMGASGSGKSTLVNLLGFIDRVYEGDYLFEEESLITSSDTKLSQIRNQNVGFIFQNFKLIENNTVFENVELPLLYSGLSTRKTSEKVKAVLQKMGILDKINKYPKQLSGGQQQRVAIARAMINDPKFIIADEPTGALDTVTSNEILTLFKQLNVESGVTIIMVTHDNEAAQYCQRIITLLDGKIIKDGGHLL